MSMLPGMPPDVGLFDRRPLAATLERVVDLDYLKAAHLPLVIVAIDIESGEAMYFDNCRQALERAQDIALASQPLLTIDAYAGEHRLRAPPARARARLPGSEDDLEKTIAREAREGEVEVVLTAYRLPRHESGAKTIGFSRASIKERWQAGLDDRMVMLEALRAGRATRREPGFIFYDCRHEAWAAHPWSRGRVPRRRPCRRRPRLVAG